tara:strand:+ start:3543 stop:3896 length:354 start_codon:yes stop_codon:yes gene_type:complete
MKQIVFCFRNGPLAGIALLEHVQMALVTKAFNATVRFVLSESGVMLASNLYSNNELTSQTRGYFKSLALYDIDEVLVEEESALNFGIVQTQLFAPASITNNKNLNRILRMADIILEA